MTTETPICTYTPTQGTSKGKRCLLPVDTFGEHDGPHIFDPTKVPAAATGTPIEGSQFTEEEVAGVLSEEEVRARSEKLNEAQELWERAHARAMPKMMCPECTGNGSVVGGSLGDHCATCNGTRVVIDDSVDFAFEMPDFAALRSGLSAYGDALIWRKNGLPGNLPPKRLEEFKKKLALPAPSTVPTMEQITDLLTRGRQKHKELAGTAPPMPQLPPAGSKPQRTGFETEGGMDETATDAEIDAIEAELAKE